MEPFSPEYLDELERRTWTRHPVQLSPDEARALIKEFLRLRGREAMLTDTVVMAAALYFERIKSASERDYASEVLHETAVELVKDNPRLKGAFPTNESER